MNDDVQVSSNAPIEAVGQIPLRAGAAACFGEPVRAGDRIAIPVAEVIYGLGFGWGGGESLQGEGATERGRGGGAGGGSRSRAIAVVEVAPDGVRVHQIFDQTTIVIAAITFASAATAIMARTLTKLIRG